jgi:hypothetical protein
MAELKNSHSPKPNTLHINSADAAAGPAVETITSRISGSQDAHVSSGDEARDDPESRLKPPHEDENNSQTSGTTEINSSPQRPEGGADAHNATLQVDTPEDGTDPDKGNNVKPLPLNSTKTHGFLEDAYRRLGWIVETVLIGGTLGILGVVGFWTFLWFANDSNSTWHWIMVNDHLKVIVSATAEVVNRLVGFMIGAECAMILGLALERAEVLFPSLAGASTGRSGMGSGKSFALFQKLVKKKWPLQGWDIRLPFLISLITIIETLTFGTHTALLSDVRLGQLPTRGNSSNISFGFAYTTQTITDAGGEEDVLLRSTSWSLKPQSYPAFAEYTEDPVVSDGISDTGLTLRAFLPYADPTRRQQLHSYSGQTTVLDARVTCQVPQFENFSMNYQGGFLVMVGFVRATLSTPRLGNETLFPDPTNTSIWIRNASTPFACIVPLSNSSTEGVPDQWRTSVCQLANDGRDDDGIAGGLVSEFRDYSTWLEEASNYENSTNFGTAYLVLNVSSGPNLEWQNTIPGHDATPLSVPDGAPDREWLQFSLQGDLSFGASLCYAAFDIADIPVKITSTNRRNRTEPLPQFNFGSKRYTFDGVRKQYGQDENHAGDIKALEDRGLFQLEKQSWIAAPGIQPPIYSYIRDSASFAGPGTNTLPYWSGYMFNAVDNYYSPADRTDNFNLTSFERFFAYVNTGTLQPDPMHVWLFQEIVSNGGSVAYALQSQLTLIASMTYYDQLAQFDNAAAVSQSVFIETNLPAAFWGWLGIVIVLSIHIFVAWLVLFWFLAATKYTLLGQKWQNLAQATTAETAKFIAMATDMLDDSVKIEMKKEEWAKKELGTTLTKARVRLRPSEEDGRLGIYLVRNESL